MTDPGTTLDVDGFRRVLKTLPDDATKDTPDQADLRNLLMWVALIGQLGPVALQKMKDATELLGGLGLPPVGED